MWQTGEFGNNVHNYCEHLCHDNYTIVSTNHNHDQDNCQFGFSPECQSSRILLPAQCGRQENLAIYFAIITIRIITILKIIVTT